MIAWLNTVGLVLNLVGVYLLFRYGMPFHVPTKGVMTLSLSQIAEDDVQREKAYSALGWIGLLLIVLGTALQIAANWI